DQEGVVAGEGVDMGARGVINMGRILPCHQANPHASPHSGNLVFLATAYALKDTLPMNYRDSAARSATKPPAISNNGERRNSQLATVVSQDKPAAQESTNK